MNYDRRASVRDRIEDTPGILRELEKIRAKHRKRLYNAYQTCSAAVSEIADSLASDLVHLGAEYVEDPAEKAAHDQLFNLVEKQAEEANGLLAVILEAAQALAKKPLEERRVLRQHARSIREG